MSQRLGDLLVKEKILSPEQLEQALKAQKEAGGKDRLGSVLVKLGLLSDEDVTNFLSRQYGVPAINLQFFEIDPAVVTERAAANIHQRISAPGQGPSMCPIARVQRVQAVHPQGAQLEAHEAEHHGIERQPRNEPCPDPLLQGRHGFCPWS